MASSQTSNYSRSRQGQPKHARPICCCLAPARLSEELCHFPVFSKPLQRHLRALGSQENSHPGAFLSLWLSQSPPAAKCHGMLQVPVVPPCSGSAGGSRVKHGMLRASCLQSQARQPGHHAGVQGHGLIPPGDRDKPLWQQCGLLAAAQMALSTVGQVPSPVLVPPALPDTSWCPKSLTWGQRQLLSQVTAATSCARARHRVQSFECL